MQEIIVFILFFGIIAYVLYRRFIKSDRDSGECSSCSFNPENQK